MNVTLGLSTGQIFYTVIARPQRGRSNPVFGWLSGLLRQDYVLPRNDKNRQFSSAVENLSGDKTLGNEAGSQDDKH
jgi:hypothetical protein